MTVASLLRSLLMKNLSERKGPQLALEKGITNAENLSCDYAKLEIKISVFDFINFNETHFTHGASNKQN